MCRVSKRNKMIGKKSTSSILTPTEPMMKVLVFGGITGWIGQKVCALLESQTWCTEVIPTGVRMEDRAAVELLLESVKPTHVVIAAGKTGTPNVDWCEDHKAEVVRANVIGTLTLCDMCHNRDIHVTNFATGCIYEGHCYEGDGFSETDEPNFERSFYSHSKVTAENMIRAAYNDSVLTLRLRMPISADLHPRSFVTKITKYEKVVDVPNSMTVLPSLLPIAIDMLRRKSTGIYNFCNPGLISHNQVLQIYKEEVDPLFKWDNFSLKEQATVLKADRSNNRLNVSKLLCEYPNVPEIKNAVREALRKHARATQ